MDELKQSRLTAIGEATCELIDAEKQLLAALRKLVPAMTDNSPQANDMIASMLLERSYDRLKMVLSHEYRKGQDDGNAGDPPANV